MPETWLECATCHARFPFSPSFRACPDCRVNERLSPLEVQYDLAAVRLPRPRAGGRGLWRWHDLLPAVRTRSRITLGEGGTPLLPLKGPAGGPAVWLKNETASPTWSWKDRPNCVSVAVAHHFGFPKVASISTGNHGCATAAYASAAGLAATVFCHEQAAGAQLDLMHAYGAATVLGGDQERLLDERIAAGDTFPCSILCPRAGYSNPYGIEGFKTIAFELLEQLGRPPDRVFVPVGSGDGIYGIWKGFCELHQLGAIGRAPRMIGCQAESADSALRAFRAGARHAERLPRPTTIALSVAEPVTGDHALRAVRESGGDFLAASDTRICQAVHDLARQGFALEPASALAFACLDELSKLAHDPEVWVVIGSGSLAKWPETLSLVAP